MQSKHLPLIESGYMCPTCRRKGIKTLDLFFSSYEHAFHARERAYVITQTDNDNAMIIDK